MEMVKEFKKVYPNMQIFVCYPSHVFATGIDINAEILKNEIMPLVDSVKRTANTSVIDFYTPLLDKGNLFPDGIHPDTAGYKLMAKIAQETILAGPTGVIRYFNVDKPSYELGESVTL